MSRSVEYAAPATFRRRIEFRPGYNYLHETGPNRRGQHGMSIAFILIGPHGATQFVMGTSWTPLGEVDGASREPIHVDYWNTDQYGRFPLTRPPSGYDLGYHWRTPQYDGQEDYGRTDCQYLPGGTCYYDGSGLRADGVLRLFVAEGQRAVWRVLASEYRSLLTREDGPVLSPTQDVPA